MGIMSSRIEVTWQAADGYVGGRRPQTTKIEVSDFVGLTRLEAEMLFDQIINEDFSQRVQWECDDYEASLSEIMAAAAALPE
jgi:hypothetical protein